MQPLLSLYDIEKRFGDRIGLQVDYLEISAGRLYLLTGPNGSGKSTMLQIMAMLEQPDRGELLFGSQRISGAGPGGHQVRQQVTLMHQNPYLIRGSVADNIAYGLRLRGFSGNRLRERVDETLELVQLTGFARRDARKLSGGESRRVALARALACGPRLLLLDEPMANLDRENAALMEQVITGLPGQGTAVVISSHDEAQLERLDAINIHLEHGRLVSPIQRRPEPEGFIWGAAELCPALMLHQA